MNTAKLKSIMVLHGDTGAVLANAIGLTPQSFSTKLNEKNGAEFTQNEIAKIKERYSLTPDEIDAIFFDVKVS